MKIYTRTGDDGTTALFSGGRVPKSHLRVETYGTVDELNAVLGVIRTHAPRSDDWLAQIQRDLFNLGSDFATPLESNSDWVVRMDEARIRWLEELIDKLESDLPPLRNFILPGGTPAAAQVHVARTVCRRAERAAVALQIHEAINPQALVYLNRLSDLLFVLARWENHQAGIAEEKWSANS